MNNNVTTSNSGYVNSINMIKKCIIIEDLKIAI